MKAGDALSMVKETASEFSADKAPRLAAALSYSTIFSIVPLFIITIAIVGWFFGLSGPHSHTRAEAQLLGAVGRTMGPDAAKTVRGMVTAAYSNRHQGLIASVISWIVFIVGATGVFAALQDALNTVWHVEPRGKVGIWTMVRERTATLGMVLGIGFLLLVSAIASAVFAFVSAYLTHIFPFPAFGALLQIATYVLSLAIITLLFALIYKVLPDAKIAWGDVWVGALVTSVLFVVGQIAIGFYLGRTGVASTYGAIGSLLVILLWIYYSSMILLFGAEFTKVFARRHGSEISTLAA